MKPFAKLKSVDFFRKLPTYASEYIKLLLKLQRVLRLCSADSSSRSDPTPALVQPPCHMLAVDAKVDKTHNRRAGPDKESLSYLSRSIIAGILRRQR